MDERGKTIRVGWYSSIALPKIESFPYDFELLSVDAPVDLQQVFDAIVLDAKKFNSLEDLKSTYTSLSLPTAILANTVEEETAILGWLDPKDEICQKSLLYQQLWLRLRRSWQHRQPQESANLDPLTKVANRRALIKYAIGLLSANEAQEPLCLLFLDIDRFKVVNDNLGHGAGDLLLQEIGQLLRQYALGAGIVARHGGDEFAIFVRGSLDRGRAFADFLRTEIAAREFQLGENAVWISASFGVASATGHSSFETLFQEVDECLYAAKEQGRNRVVTAEEFEAIADATGQDKLITDFENRIRVIAQRMSSELVLKARRLAKQYRTEADRDGLTGVFNRRHLDRLLSREMDKSRKYDRELTVMLLDLDRFGDVNRTYGFPTGDRALKSAAAVLQRSIRAGDWVARYGGEEFCVVMLDTELKTGCQVAERIRQAMSVETVTAYDGRQFQVTASIGVAQFLLDDADVVALFQRVSDKVRQAKQEGRDRIRF
jgi:diguanylate cyclase (GGDEF)-like protein